MKRSCCIALALAALLLGPAAARAQVFGQFTHAQTVPVNGHLFGAYLDASENFFGVLTQLRLSFYPNVDFGFQGGLTRIDFGRSDATAVRLGGDFKYWSLRASDGAPFDLAVGAALGVDTGDRINVLMLGPSVVASRDLSIGSSTPVTPYVGVGLLISNLDVHDSESTDISVPLKVGSEFRIAEELRLIAEFQFRIKDDFNDNLSFVTGVNLPF